MLDKNSLKIIHELCHDGRSNNVELARRLNLSVRTVAKKVNELIDKDIIAIKAMPNPAKMGYQAQAFIGMSVDLKKIDNIYHQLQTNIHVNMVTTSFGRFDILIFVFFRDLTTLQDYIKKELPLIDGINRIQTYLISEEKKRNKGIFPKISKNTPPIMLDKIDQNLIEELIHDGRPNYTDLSKKLGISKPTLSRRINMLLKESVIKIVAIPIPSTLGYSANAFILIRAKLSKVDKICNLISRFPEVHLVMRIMNDFDILVGVYSANPDTLHEFLKNKIGYIDGLLSTETFIRGNYHYFSADAVFPPLVS